MCENKVFPVITVLPSDPGNYRAYLEKQTRAFLYRTTALLLLLHVEKKKSSKWVVTIPYFFALAKPKEVNRKDKGDGWVTQLFEGEERFAGICDRDFCVYDTWLSKRTGKHQPAQCSYVSQ